MTEPLRSGGCHCGAIRFDVRLAGGLDEARRCNCSLCRMRGAVALSAAVEDFTLTQGEDRLATYRFNTKVAEHHFCSVCGIYTHHKRRSHPDQYGINAACIDGLSPFDFAEVPVHNGAHHVKDGGSDRVVGVLKFVPAVPHD